MLLEEQVQIRDLVMGPGTPYTMLTEFNPYVFAARVSGGGERAWAHGTWGGAEWGSERVVAMRILISGDTDDSAGWLTAFRRLTAAMRPIGTGQDVELRWVRGGVEQMLRGRPRMVEPEQQLIHAGKSFVQCAFVAQDPVIYSGELYEFGPIELPSTVGGLTLPTTAPFVIPARTVGGEVHVVNEGDEPTGMVWTLRGPLSGITIHVGTPDGEQLALRVLINLGAADYLVIDTKSRTVLLNGTANRRGDVSGDFPLIPPGTSRIRLRAFGSGTLSGSWRSAWW